MTVSCLATVIHQPISPLFYCILTIYITDEDFIIDCTHYICRLTVHYVLNYALCLHRRQQHAREYTSFRHEHSFHCVGYSSPKC